MKIKRFEGYIVFASLLVIFTLSLYIRTVLPYNNVFVDQVRFASDDAVFHMRLVENALFGDHFPQRLFFDVFTNYPHGTWLHFAPLFDQLLIFAVWITGLGHPTFSLMETVGAYYPAVLGSLIIFPVYIIGRELHNKYTGLISAFIIATLPGQFLSRSLLGFTDHHVAEVLFSTILMMYFVLALKKAKEEDNVFGWKLKYPFWKYRYLPWFVCYVIIALSLFYILPWEWGIFFSFIMFLCVPLFLLFKYFDSYKYLIYSILAGMALGFYLLTWTSGMFFILIILFYGIVQSLVNGIREESNDYLWFVLPITFYVALIMIAPFTLKTPFYDIKHILSLGGCAFVFMIPLLYKKLRRYSSLLKIEYEQYIPLLTIVTIFFVMIIFFPTMLHAFHVFKPHGNMLTVAEVFPLDIARAWVWFTMPFFVSFFALILVGFEIISKNRSQHVLLLVWSLIMFVTIGGLGIFGIEDIGQNRFAYYYAINVALLCGLFFTKVVEYLTVVDIKLKNKQPTKRIKGKKQSVKNEDSDLYSITFAFSIMLMFVTGIIKIGIKCFIPLLFIVLLYMLWKHFDKNNNKNKEQLSKKAIVCVFVCFIIFYPFPLNVAASSYPNNLPLGISYSINTAKGGVGGADSDWYEALLWLKDNTPDTGVDYYGYYKNDYTYPSSSYGVMSWWDYGHIITWIAHRIPNANPFQQGIGDSVEHGAAQFFIEDDESKVNQMADEFGVRYVISDFMMADVWNSLYNKYGAMTVWAGDPQQYQNLVYYYRSMEAKLHMFDGTTVNVEGDVIPSLEHYRLIHESPTFILPFIVINENTGQVSWSHFSGSYDDMNRQADVLHGELPFTLDNVSQMTNDLNNDMISDILKQSFDSIGLLLSDDCRVIKINVEQWIIRDDINKNTFIIKKDGDLLKVYLYGIRTPQEGIKVYTPEYIEPVAFVKIFEYVEGAIIEGIVEPNQTVELSVSITTNQGRTFIYTQIKETDENGNYSFTVPYSTGQNYDVVVSPYIIKIGEEEKEVIVNDDFGYNLYIPN